MTFWDSSALFPLFVEEPASRSARADPFFVVWTFTPIEIWGAACRRRRAGHIDKATLEASWTGALLSHCAALRSRVSSLP